MSGTWGRNTARDALEGARTAIGAAGSPTPRLDAEVLLAHVLGTTRERLLIDDPPVQGPAVRAFQDAVIRRARDREPVAYITGRRAFRFIELHVDRRVLVPRPETELLVEIGLTLPRGASVLDVCTGSGAVALALKSERPDLQVSAADIDPGALDVARANVVALGVDVTLRRADLLDGIEEGGQAVLANPPYVATGASLAPEITRHEPAGALFAGVDGLDVVRRLIADARRVGAALLACEIGEGQAAAVRSLAREAGWPSIEFERDLAGIERVLVARA